MRCCISACMKTILSYLRDYFRSVNMLTLALSVLFTAAIIFVNYRFGLERTLRRSSFFIQFAAWYGIFLLALSFSYIIAAKRNKAFFKQPLFLLLLLLAPALFSLKLTMPINLPLSNTLADNRYWNTVLYYPAKLLLIAICLFIIWRNTGKDGSRYGTKLQGFSLKPYLIMLLLMLPLIALASTQHDFLTIYPKLLHVRSVASTGWWQKLLYELSYGCDFINIELFFRGFLILAFAPIVGKDCILPMAVFYCTIHFGKSLGECISSFFGGIILGVVSYNTRNIYGGLIVHLGIAWLMELGGYLGTATFY